MLVWKAPTTAMNPTIAEAFIAGELEKDEAAARGEYWPSSGPTSRRSSPARSSSRASSPAVASWPGCPGCRIAPSVDPSGGSGGDSFTLGGRPLGGASRAADRRARRGPGGPAAVLARVDDGRSRGAAPDLRRRARSWVIGSRRVAQRAVPEARRHVHGLGADEVGPLPRRVAVAQCGHRRAARPSPARRATLRVGAPDQSRRAGQRSTMARTATMTSPMRSCGVIADLLVHAPGSDGGPVPMNGTTIRPDLAAWAQPARVRAYNAIRLGAARRRGSPTADAIRPLNTGLRVQAPKFLATLQHAQQFTAGSAS